MKGKLHRILMRLCFLTLISANAFSPLADARTLLLKIRTPQQILFPCLPKSYCAQINLSGTCAQEINNSIKAMKLPSAQFIENFDGNDFSMQIANPEYPIYTRDLLSAILNPVDMIEMILESMLCHRTGPAFEKLLKETKITPQGTSGSRARWALLPHSDRFSYSFRDLGSVINENWFLAMEFDLDTSRGLLHQLTTTRCNRLTKVSYNQPTAIDTIATQYIITYKQLDSLSVPSRLDIIKNRADTLMTIRASYKKQGKYVLFSRKEIFTQRNAHSSLIIDYISYTYRHCPRAILTKGSQITNYSRRLSAASNLARRASQEIRNGNISSARRVLEELVSKYEGTPQAVEARNVLLQFR